MADDLRAKIADELHANRCGCGAPDAQSRHDAETAIDVFAGWLLDEAADIQAQHDGDPGDNHVPIIEHLRWLATSLTQPSTEEAD